jgi:hypothetical protein
MNRQDFDKWKEDFKNEIYGKRDEYAMFKGGYSASGIETEYVFEAFEKFANLLSKEIDGKDKLIEDHEKAYNEVCKNLQKYEEEIERLKRLIKEGFILLQQQWKKSLGQIDTDWAKFKKDNQL